jgi:hypothetical protein
MATNAKLEQIDATALSVGSAPIAALDRLIDLVVPPSFAGCTQHEMFAIADGGPDKPARTEMDAEILR